MAARKTSAAEAESLKKRKRDKAEEAAGRTKKRKPQVGDDKAAAAPMTTTATAETPKMSSRSPGKKNGAPRTDVVVAPSTALAAPATTSTWRLSEPMGGCIASIDPVFSADEAHLILCYNTSLQVYSTDDSLLERRINLPVDHDRPQSRIVAAVLSPTTPSLVWVGCVDGSLFRADWATGAVEAVRRYSGSGDSGKPRPQLAAMAVERVRVGASALEVLYLSEGVPSSGSGGAAAAWRVAAYDAAALSRTPGRTLFTAPAAATGTIDLLRTTSGGRFVVGARGPTVFVGALKGSAKTRSAGGAAAGTGLDRLAYQFYALDAPDAIACLDVLATLPAKRMDGNDDEEEEDDDNATADAPVPAVLDLVVGCVRGAIYVYGDVYNRLRSAAAPAVAAAGTKRRGAVAVQPRKHHWHQRSVCAVKWSQDGNYFVSGGLETVLVLWQTDTGRLEFLPHLSASIENIVVSPRGSSYALHLDDNSAMVLSTAEMQPTCYVAGLQSLAISPVPPRDAQVRRAWMSSSSSGAATTTTTAADIIHRPVPAVVHPADASRLLLRVGSSSTPLSGDQLPSASLLQTFDLAAFRSVARQPLARTNPTDANLTLRGYPVTEPTITHLCASRDGRWLASVDEWQPPVRDISGLGAGTAVAAAGGSGGGGGGDWARSRREIHLKFWSVGGNDGSIDNSDSNPDDSNTYELVSRIDDAHFSAQQTESILGVAADPRHANRFATLGDDGVLRIWGIKTRVRDGLVARDDRGRPLVSWHCLQAVPLPEEAGAERATDARPRSGALAFSEDGSTVFAALGAPDAGVLYTVDADAGAVRSTLHGLFRGAVRGVAVLGAALVLLSADLRVYDMVADSLRYGVRLLGSSATAGTAAESDFVAAAAMTQLAVDRHAQAFLVAVPYRPATTTTAGGGGGGGGGSRKKTAASRLLVFSPDRARPLFAHDLPTLVVSLLPSVGRAGFVAIDAAAQVWSLADAADTATLGQSLADLHLPTTSEERASREADGEAENDDDDDNDKEEEEEDEEARDKEMKDVSVRNGHAADAGDDDDDDDNDGLHSAAVIPQQKLQDIFEAAPVSASTSIEDLFWQVSGLLTGLPSNGVKA